MTDEQCALIAAAAFCGARGHSMDQVPGTAKRFLGMLDDLVWAGDDRNRGAR
jgi:hypothetical protein